MAKSCYVYPIKIISIFSTPHAGNDAKRRLEFYQKYRTISVSKLNGLDKIFFRNKVGTQLMLEIFVFILMYTLDVVYIHGIFQ
jgi:hypothetical protein